MVGTPPFELGGLGEGEPAPWPEDFKDFNTHNVSFWELGPLPVGSVLTFTIEPTESSDSGEPAVVACVVHFSGKGRLWDLGVLQVPCVRSGLGQAVGREYLFKKEEVFAIYAENFTSAPWNQAIMW